MAEQGKAKLEWPYIATSTLLVAHEIDGAVWQEWNLFPWAGGSQAFVLENIVLTLPFLWGIVWLVRAPRVGARFAVVLAALGIAAFGVHMWLFAQGRPGFRTPVSIGVLVCALSASIVLGWRSIRLLLGREDRQRPGHQKDGAA